MNHPLGSIWLKFLFMPKLTVIWKRSKKDSLVMLRKYFTTHEDPRTTIHTIQENMPV